MLNFGFNFGWTNGFLAAVASAFTPSDLGASLIQWLFGNTAPSAVDDISDNAVDANYVDSVCYVAEAGSSWAVAELVGTETVTSSEGTSTPSISAGTISFTAGTAWNIVLSNGSIYHCTENSGLTAYDVVNGYHATLTVGAGGEAVAWGTRQSDHHDMAFRGGTVAFTFDNVSSVSLTGYNNITAGTKSLSMRVKPNGLADQYLFFSNGKTLFLDYLGGNTYDIWYNGINTTVSINSGVWSTITLDVDVASEITFGSGANDWEMAWATLADNGSWYAAGFDGTTAYNSDQQTPMPNLADNAVGLKQYPANAALTDDVDGAGYVNTPTGIHNGGIYAIQQDAGDATLLAYPFYSADGVNYDKKTYADYFTDPSFSGNTVKKWASASSGLCILTDAVVFDNLTAAEYDNMVTWQGGGSCGAGVLTPALTVEGDYALTVEGYVAF
jgi:hypothetical protein